MLLCIITRRVPRSGSSGLAFSSTGLYRSRCSVHRTSWLCVWVLELQFRLTKDVQPQPCRGACVVCVSGLCLVGPSAFYRPSPAFSFSRQRFATQIVADEVFWSTSTTSCPQRTWTYIFSLFKSIFVRVCDNILKIWRQIFRHGKSDAFMAIYIGAMMPNLVCKHINFLARKWTEADFSCSPTKHAILEQHDLPWKMLDFLW